MIRHLKETGKLKPRNDAKDAAFGTSVHAAWADPEIKLDGFAAETLDKLKRLEQMLLTDWAAGREVALFAREQRLWLHYGITPMHSGRYDVAYVTTDFLSMLLIDGKTLTSPVTPADSNDQLRELVALAHDNYPAIQDFTVAIAQPNADKPVSVAFTTLSKPNSRFASCAGISPKSRLRTFRGSMAIGAGTVPLSSSVPKRKAAIEPILAYQLEREPDSQQLVLPIGESGAAFLRRLLLAEHLINTLKTAYKAFLAQNPDDLPGFALKPGRTKREIKDIRAAYDALQDVVALPDFLSAASVSVTKLQEVYGAATRAQR